MPAALTLLKWGPALATHMVDHWLQKTQATFGARQQSAARQQAVERTLECSRKDEAGRLSSFVLKSNLALNDRFDSAMIIGFKSL